MRGVCSTAPLAFLVFSFVSVLCKKCSSGMWRSIRADFDDSRCLVARRLRRPSQRDEIRVAANGRVAEVTQLVARDHDPPVSARAPSLSLHTEKSLAVRSRGGSDMRLGGRSAVMSKPPGGERKAGWLLDDERKSSLRFALRGEADYNLRIGAAPPATRASLRTGAALSMSKSGMPSEQAEGGHSDAPPRAA